MNDSYDVTHANERLEHVKRLVTSFSKHIHHSPVPSKSKKWRSSLKRVIRQLLLSYEAFLSNKGSNENNESSVLRFGL